MGFLCGLIGHDIDGKLNEVMDAEGIQVTEIHYTVFCKRCGTVKEERKYVWDDETCKFEVNNVGQ